MCGQEKHLTYDCIFGILRPSIFGQNLNKKNLNRFFTLTAIQLLWSKNFVQSVEYLNFEK